LDGPVSEVPDGFGAAVDGLAVGAAAPVIAAAGPVAGAAGPVAGAAGPVAGADVVADPGAGAGTMGVTIGVILSGLAADGAGVVGEVVVVVGDCRGPAGLMLPGGSAGRRALASRTGSTMAAEPALRAEGAPFKIGPASPLDPRTIAIVATAANSATPAAARAIFMRRVSASGGVYGCGAIIAARPLEYAIGATRAVDGASRTGDDGTTATPGKMALLRCLGISPL
jgi:hypothetical protein